MKGWSKAWLWDCFSGAIPRYSKGFRNLFEKKIEEVCHPISGKSGTFPWPGFDGPLEVGQDGLQQRLAITKAKKRFLTLGVQLRCFTFGDDAFSLKARTNTKDDKHVLEKMVSILLSVIAIFFIHHDIFVSQYITTFICLL